MDLSIVRGGKFTFTIPSKELLKGLRPVEGNARNSDSLLVCKGAVGREGVLQALETLSRIDTSTITDGFPFPQVFVFTSMVIVCSLLKVYEWDGSSLTLKYTAPSAGGTWTAVDFYDYIYMSNGKVAVVRDAGSKTYAASSVLPHATAMCNYNGQVLVGAPDVDGLGASMLLVAAAGSTTMTMIGTVSTT